MASVGHHPSTIHPGFAFRNFDKINRIASGLDSPVSRPSMKRSSFFSMSGCSRTVMGVPAAGARLLGDFVVSRIDLSMIPWYHEIGPRGRSELPRSLITLHVVATLLVSAFRWDVMQRMAQGVCTQIGPVGYRIKEMQVPGFIDRHRRSHHPG